MTKIIQKRLFKNYTLNNSKTINIYTHKIYKIKNALFCDFVIKEKVYKRKINITKSKYFNKELLYINFKKDKFVLMAI